jgi:hypothetical protein
MMGLVITAGALVCWPPLPLSRCPVLALQMTAFVRTCRGQSGNNGNEKACAHCGHRRGAERCSAARIGACATISGVSVTDLMRR